MPTEESLPRSGALRPPGELGHALSPSESDLSKGKGGKHSKAHPAVLKAYQDEEAAIKRNHRARHAAATPPSIGTLSLVTALCYNGMPIVVGTTRHGCYVICPQTHFLYQTLSLGSSAEIIALVSCDETGLLVVAHADGYLQTYLPRSCDPATENFGPYRWWDAAYYDCKSLFSAKDFKGDLDVSLSHNYKFLVAHADQLAVLSIHSSVDAQGPMKEAEIVWTTQLPGRVALARISGNAHSMAVVLQKNAGDDDDGSEGVHTFDRDWNDGSQADSSLGPTQRATLMRSTSVGILYRPGPFLVHNAAVTTLSFRGLGHLHSVERGNDLLLTHCARDSVARIFAQHDWKELVDWTTLRNTRVEWIRGISAFTLGDLASHRSRKSGTMPRTKSEEDMYEILGKGAPTHSVPNHAQPYSGAGAWISELSFQGSLSTIRLSRLTYLQRGIDEAYPTLFECVSSLVPPNTFFSHGILDTISCGFCVQAIWPAWNPWLSDTNNRTDDTDTLRGSAMSFLGLSTGMNSTGGHFGGSLLGITETPPLELRITIMLIGFRLRGDETAIDVELPRRAELSLADLDRFIVSKTETTAPQASRQHESGRLSARVSTTLQSVDVLWHRPGSFLPSTWQPKDVDRLGKALAEATVVHDESLLSVPLVESLFHLPKELRHESITDVLWWPIREPKFGGQSYLAAITTGGSIVIFSVPPPYGFLETSMPDKDECFPDADEGRISHAHSFTSEKSVRTRSEYEVFITPDPDHGLGLRLESKVDGLCAVAGSFKKHPLNGDMLPAERTGMICLGDELISANGIDLENQRFEDIIARVRESGLSAGPGNPICLKFRPLQQISIVQNIASRSTFESGDGGQTSSHIDLKTSSSIGSIKSASQCVSSLVSFGRADTFSNVIAVVEGALTTSSGQHTSDWRFVLVSLFQLIESSGNGALFIAVNGAEVQVFSIFLNEGASGAKFEKLDQLNVSGGSDRCYALSTLRIFIGGVELALWDVKGKLSLLRISIDQGKDKRLGVTFKLYEGVQLCEPPSLVRGYSYALFATMTNSDEGRGKSIVVYSCTSHSGQKDETQFASQEIRILSDPNDDRIVDFCFLSSGYLASAPILVVFSCTGLILYRKTACSMVWTPSLKIWYTKLKDSRPYFSILDDLTVYECVPGISMVDSLPHLLSGLSLTHQAKHEENCLLNDWSPESLLAYICCESRGINHALQSYVLDIMRWVHSECKSFGFDFLDRALPCAPIDICKKLNLLHADHDNEAVHSTVDHRQTGNNDALDEFLRDILITFDEKCQVDGKGRNDTNNVAPSTVDKGPSSILRLEFDLRMFHAIGQLALAPPNFQATDSCGELFLFAAFLMHQLERDADNQCELNNDTEYAMIDIPRQSRTQFLTDFHVASSACLAAMISSDQENLLERCRPLWQKLNWDNAKKLRIPLWLRSDVALAKLCEEIGQTSFRQGRDVMDCAIFFIACGKLRTLTNLAATDQSEVGKKFFKFLTSHDFESTKGRLAAEKNAFSLLRKNKHRAAASFFLLSKPPSLKSAVETILTKLNDIDLAFLVMRLMTNIDVCKEASPSLLSLGGGYTAASAYKVGISDHNENQEPDFQDWRSGLSISARNFLIDRLLPMAVDDSALTSVILYWLNEKDLSPWILSKTVGIAFDKQGGHSLFKKDAMDWIPSGSFTRSCLVRNVDVLAKSNQIIDIVSRPTLLLRLKSPDKPLLTAVLSTSSTLLASGLELPALQTLFKLSHAVRDGEKKIAERPQMSSIIKKFHNVSQRTSVLNVPYSSGAMDSSICDDFAGQANPNQQTNHSAPGAIESSIFDDFAGPPKPIQQSNHSASGAMESSIFDDFSGPPKQAQQPNHSAPGAMESSIFDSFTGPPKHVQQTNPSASGAMESSIFDDFSGPPKQAQQPNHSAPGAMESSIFDSFTGPPKHVQQTNPSASGAMESSIFDDFSGPPKQAQQPNHSAPGAMESSIFDSFTGPPKHVQQTSPSASGAMESSIFDDFVVPRMLVGGTSASFSGINKAQHASQQQPPCRDKNIPEVELQLHLSIEPLQSPQIWNELMSDLKCTGAARRLLREIARVFDNCQTDPTESPIDFLDKQNSIIAEVSSVLQLPCDGESMLTRAEEILADISDWSQIDSSCLIQRALSIIETADKKRLVFEVVLHCISGRSDLAEFAVRVASRCLIDRCFSLVRSTDTSNQRRIPDSGRPRDFYVNSPREYAGSSSCACGYTGAIASLSPLGIKESICAIRLGLLIASWNRDYASIQALVENPPDCPLDENTGRLLWTSLCCNDSEKPQVKEKGGTSGGWEFLVDCKRSQATDMLKDRPTGCFIIRPHTKDHGVFTLSFKTNLKPVKEEKEDEGEANAESLSAQLSDQESSNVSTGQATKSAKKNDVVQHAIIRLSESGFRCGSFGPFASLMSLLEAVSASLPFKLRFDKPPANHLILDEGSQTSPNAVLIHKLAALIKEDHSVTDEILVGKENASSALQTSAISGRTDVNETAQLDRVKIFSSFLNLMKVLSMCRQLTSVAAVTSDDESKVPECVESDKDLDINACRQYQVLEAHRILHPFLSWCRAAEILVMSDFTSHPRCAVRPLGISVAGASEESKEVQAVDRDLRGDGMLRKMIQQGSGVEFSTLRLVDGGECTMVVLFKRNDALEWLVSSGYEQSEAEAANRLASMENARFIEPVDLSKLRLKHKGAATEEVVTYRFIDPWEVEALENRDAETRSATLGRNKVLGFSLKRVSFALDPLLLAIGGVPLLDLWNSLLGGVMLTKAIASLHPPWERAAGGDLIIGSESSQSPYVNSIRKMLYRDSIFRALRLPQRFITLLQVELLDLKNLTSPGGSLALTVYALLRPKRAGHGANLTNKARTLDSAATQPIKLTKSSGPNAPASWGSVVRFRFALPEDVPMDGTSRDSDQESIFKGPPTFLQLSVYEKKLLVDHLLGSADVSMDGLWPGGQLEEWVPLRSDKSSITWFARIRLTLRFELMCLAEKGSEAPDREAPSVGLRRIEELSRAGGAAHEERFEKRSLSSPDLLSYFESMVY